MKTLILVVGVSMIVFAGTRERVSEALSSTGLAHGAAHVLTASAMGALVALLAYALLGRPQWWTRTQRGRGSPPPWAPAGHAPDGSSAAPALGGRGSSTSAALAGHRAVGTRLDRACALRRP